MLKNYFKTAWRNLTKNKAFSFINVFGLTAGLTACLMIFLFVSNEFSVDSFHRKGKNIYRVERSYDPQKPPAAWLANPYGPALLNDFPGEIKQMVRVLPNNEALVVYKDRSFYEKSFYLADTNFFTFFSFPLLRGNPATVLRDANTVVLTESLAGKIFGHEDPIGRMVQINKGLMLMVTGIAKDVPVNSTLSFNMVMSLRGLVNLPFMKDWVGNGNFTYILLDEHANRQRVESRLPAFMEKYLGAQMRKNDSKFVLSLQPLRDVYFENASPFDKVRHGDKKVVYIFLSIALLIILIACINFMNLSTIRAADRSKEVGLRKVLGALRHTLIEQFLGESLLLAVISCLLSLALLQLLLPVYNGILGYKLTVPYTQWWLYAFLGAAAIMVGLLAGSYPALILSRFSPVEAIKGKFRLGKGGSNFRQVLVVVQFSISVFLITGTIVIAKQMSYIKNKTLGYQQEQTLVIPLVYSDVRNHLGAFKQELNNNPSVASVCMMSGEPGGFFDQYGFEVEGQDGKTWGARTEYADFEFVKTLGLKLIAGRDLSSQFPTDTMSAVLINRTAAASLHFSPEQAIGKWIRNTIRDSARRRIVGVVEDFNYTSLKENIAPLVIAPNMDRNVAVVRLKPGNLSKHLDELRNVFAKVAPLYPFDYTFLDQQFDQLYKNDLRQQKILGIFSGLAIIIACLGLFGLTSFTATRRTREIGVRKVLGSSVQNIIFLLAKDLLRPVAIATLVAIPMAYMVMNSWLQGFAYRTGLQWWIFAGSAAITVAIAVGTVAVKALKAALANPTKSLRSE